MTENSLFDSKFSDFYLSSVLKLRIQNSPDQIDSRFEVILMKRIYFIHDIVEEYQTSKKRRKYS
jgi:hypothetical protein